MSKLSFQALRNANASRAPRWHTSDAGMNEWTIGDWFMAMAGEVGEGADELLPLMFMSFVGKLGALGNMGKKYRRVQEGIANKSADPNRHITDDNAISKMFEELADVQIYLDLFALRLRESLNTGEDIGDHVEKKFNKTSEMYGFPERLINGEFVLARQTTAYERSFTMSLDANRELLKHGFDKRDRRAKDRRQNVRPVRSERRMGNRRDNWLGQFVITTGETEDTRIDQIVIQGYDYATCTAIAQFAMASLPEGMTFKCDPPLNPIDLSAIESQNREFDALRDLATAFEILCMVAVVDDDYPMYRRRYEGRMRELLRRMKDNGRTLPPWK